MKKLLIGSTLAAISLTAAIAFASPEAGGGVPGSVHDMTVVAPGSDPYDRVCAYCHTPHHAIDPGSSDYMPLWSHALTNAAGYTAYDSVTFTANGAVIIDPLYGPSRLCMSCHDGLTAIDQHYGKTGTVGQGSAYYTTGRNALGGNAFNPAGTAEQGGIFVGRLAVAGGQGNLSDTHPIGFNYEDVQSQIPNDIFPSDSTFLNNPAGKTIGDGLYEGVMTCATCHDVHNKDNVSLGNYNFLLYAPQEGSQICLSCHNK